MNQFVVNFGTLLRRFLFATLLAIVAVSPIALAKSDRHSSTVKYIAYSIINSFFSNVSEKLVTRDNMANYFPSFRNSTLKTDTDLLLFNERIYLIPDLYYVKYHEGRFYSLRSQMNGKFVITKRSHHDLWAP